MIAFLGTGLARLLGGDLFGGLLYPLTNIFGGWTYAIGFGMIFVMLLFKSQSVIMPLVVFIIEMPIVLFLVTPAAWPIFGVFTVVGITSIFAKAWLSRG